MTTAKLTLAGAFGLAMILAGPAAAQIEDIYVSASGSGYAGGVRLADEDIVLCKRNGGPGTCAWEMFFDGSEENLSRRVDMTAFHVLDDDNILMSFNTVKRIGNLTLVDDSAIVQFDRTADPGNAFSHFFDGASVGLNLGGEAIDAIGFTPTGGGRLVISTDGDYDVPQTGGGTLSGGDEDLIVFNGTTGPAGTSGDWELFFDGSAVGLNTFFEDVWGAWIDRHTDEVYLTTRKWFTVDSLSGEGNDIFVCDPANFDPILGCASVDKFFDAGLEDFAAKSIDGLFIVNNDPPEITSDGGGATALVSVDENTTAVTDVQTTDDNDAEGAGLAYGLTGGADSGLFSLDANSGVLAFNAAPDFENPADSGGDNDYEVQVTVTDTGGLSDSQDITVRVANVNDGPPEIISDGGGATAAIDVAENTTAVTDVDSTDPDDAEGAGLSYSLTGGADSGLFSLDADSGMLAFSSAPDFENPADAGVDNDYEVQVTVTDSGPGAPLSDVQDITVSVTNVNEMPEIISNGGGATAAVSIDENTTAVTDVETVDAENAEGAGLAYSLTGGADSALFSLDANSGVLTFTAAPDFETPVDAGADNVYDVQVAVTDSGPGGSLSDVQDIAVTVLDVAVENLPPEIITSATPSVPENQTGVIDVNATDDSDSEGAGLSYAKTGGADAGHFSLDANSGVLAFLAAPDFENPTDANNDNDYLVQVTVTDSGPGGNLSDVQELIVSITNVNEAPTAVDQAYNATGNVPINVPAVGLLSGSSDPDATDTLTVSGVGNVSPGAIVTANPDGSFSYTPAPGFTGLDTFEYILIDDGAGNLLSNSATVRITVTDMIWFVDAANTTCTPSCDGRLTSPFNDLAVTADSFDVNAADAASDKIFLGEGSYSGGLALLDSQMLIGDGSSSALETITGISLAPLSLPLPVFSGVDPVITSAANAINLASGNTIRGLTIGNTTGTGLNGTGVGTAAVSETSIIGTGTGVNISTGTLAMSFDEISSSNAAGINLSGVSGDFDVTMGTIDSGSAVAVSIAGSPIDLGVTFTSVSANGATNGININNTTGSFTVTGDGSTATQGGNDSGGIIQNTSSDGVVLSNANGITLRNMTIGDPSVDSSDTDYAAINVDGDGIMATTVTGLTLTNVTIARTGGHGLNSNLLTGLTVTDSLILNAGDGDEEHGFNLDELRGDNFVTDSFFDGFNETGIELINASGTVDLTVADTIFQDNNATNGNFGEEAILIEAQGTASIVVLVTGTASPGTTDSIFDDLESQAIQAISVGASSDIQLTIEHSSFLESGSGDGVIIMNPDGSGSGNVTVRNNMFTDDTFGPFAVLAKNDSSGTLDVTVQNNTVTNMQLLNVNHDDVSGAGAANGTSRVLVQNNSVTVGTNNIAVDVIATETGPVGTAPDLSLTALGNTTSQPDGNFTFAPGLRLSVLNATRANFNISGNSFQGDPTFAGGSGIELTELDSSVVGLEGFGGGNAVATQAFIDAANPLSAAGSFVTSYNSDIGSGATTPPTATTQPSP